MIPDTKKWKKKWRPPEKVRCEVNIKTNDFWLHKTMVIVFLWFYICVKYLHNMTTVIQKARNSETSLK